MTLSCTCTEEKAIEWFSFSSERESPLPKQTYRSLTTRSYKAVLYWELRTPVAYVLGLKRRLQVAGRLLR